MNLHANLKKFYLFWLQQQPSSIPLDRFPNDSLFMQQFTCEQAAAEAANTYFDGEVVDFLRHWIAQHQDQTLLQFDQPLESYLANNALRDFFLNSAHPLLELLQQQSIAGHLERTADQVYFDPMSGDPLFSFTEQRIYNLARRLDSEHMDVPFRTVQPNKQTESGDTADISTYPADSEELRYNSGNHFSSRPANANVFDENSRHCTAESADNLTVLFKRGYLEERLQDIKEHTLALFEAGERELQFFVICSRHSLQEGHFGASLVIMDPANPYFPLRVLICDTLLKELPQHPRWWHHFVAEYSNVFGDAVAEIIEDLSHPLQKVNIKGDAPYRHDWDCPYYVTSMTEALAGLVKENPELIINGTSQEIHNAMKYMMPEYYLPGELIKDRADIKQANLAKRWNSGRALIGALVSEITRSTSYEF